jgi:hypothetical protein
MSRFAIYLTLPGYGGSRVSPPPPPASPPPAPTMLDVSAGRARANAAARALVQQGTGGTIRNTGGAQGLGISDTQRALKTLTGQ